MMSTGADENLGLALIKSISEMGEEIIFRKSIRRPVAIAGGFTSSSAKDRCLNEYFERKALDWHIQTQNKFEFIGIDEESGIVFNRVCLSDRCFLLGYLNRHNFKTFSIFNENSKVAKIIIKTKLLKAYKYGLSLYDPSLTKSISSLITEEKTSNLYITTKKLNELYPISLYSVESPVRFLNYYLAETISTEQSRKITRA